MLGGVKANTKCNMNPKPKCAKVTEMTTGSQTTLDPEDDVLFVICLGIWYIFLEIIPSSSSSSSSSGSMSKYVWRTNETHRNHMPSIMQSSARTKQTSVRLLHCGESRWRIARGHSKPRTWELRHLLPRWYSNYTFHLFVRPFLQ